MFLNDDKGKSADVIRLEHELRDARDESIHAREKAAELQQLLAGYFQYIPVLSFIKDEQGRYLYASESFAKFFNVEPGDFLGKTDFEWLPEHLARQFTENDNRVREMGKPIETLESVQFPTGTIHSIVCKFPIHTPSGRLFVGGTAVDITGRRAAEELSAQLAVIVEFSHDAIIGKSLDGIVASWNRGAQEVFGYEKEEIIGQPISCILPPELRGETQVMHVLNLAERVEHFETEGLRKDGQVIYLSLTISPIYNADGRLIGTSVSARDVTKRKILTTQLEQARDEALRASKVKSTFLSCMSHELRTPLSAIQCANQLLLQSTLNQDQQMLANIIKGSSEALLQMVTDVLDLSAIESSRMTVSNGPFSPGALAFETLQSLSERLRAKKLQFRVALSGNIPEVVMGDARKIKQILMKLLDNAIKFTEAGSIVVTLRVVAEDEQYITLQFSVEDTGIGIAETDLKSLFQPFTQLDSSSSRKYGGTGLGLTLCKSLLDLMHGEVTVSSSPAKGSTFSFRVPFLRWVEA